MAIMSFEGGKVQILDTSGDVLDGGKLTFNEVGTSTKKDTFTTSALSVANANPVVLDSAGRATIWMTGNYDVVITDKNDVSVYTFDDTNFTSASTTSSFNLIENGSFEVNDDGDAFPDNWVTTVYTGGTAALDTSDQRHAKQSLKFTSTGTGGGYVTSSNFMEVSALIEMVLQWEMKSDDAAVRNLVQIKWYTAAEVDVSTTSIYDDSTTNPTSWAAKLFYATPPATATLAKLEMYGCHSSDPTTGSTWFDNVVFRQYDQKLTKGTDIASATTVTVPDGIQYADITGTNAITLISSNENWVKFQFDGALVLTHHATNLILPSGANITTAAGDEAEFVQFAADDWRCTNYVKADGTGLKPRTIGTPVATTSGTSHDITGIPSWVTRVTIMIVGMSTNGTSAPILQLGDSGGMEATGYIGCTSRASTGVLATVHNTGIMVGSSHPAAGIYHGAITISKYDSATNEWIASGTLGQSGTTSTSTVGGYKSLTGVLTQLRLTMVNGTDAFDAGEFNISYE